MITCGDWSTLWYLFSVCSIERPEEVREEQGACMILRHGHLFFWTGESTGDLKRVGLIVKTGGAEYGRSSLAGELVHGPTLERRVHLGG